MKNVEACIARVEAALAELKAELLGSEDDNPMKMDDADYSKWAKKQASKQKGE